MRSEKSCDLNRCFLCSSSLPAWKEAISTHKKTLAFRKGESIFMEGEPVKGLHYLVEGTVKLHKHWSREKELIVRFARPGDILGFRELGAQDVHPVSATALEPVKVCFSSTEFFIQSLEVNPRLSLNLNFYFARELREAEERMRDLAHMDSRGRIARLLLKLQDQFGTDALGNIGIRLSRQDMASFAGTTYENLFRILQEMTDKGWIRQTGKEIALLAPERLRELIGTSLAG